MKYNPDDRFTAIPEPIYVYNVNEFGSTSGTVFPVIANGKKGLKINNLFDTGAMKSIMSLAMYNTLRLQKLDKANIPCIIGASGESLGALGRARCEVNINGNIFYQTFMICEHLKRPIILGRDFAIQNCIGISWTKNNT